MAVVVCRQDHQCGLIGEGISGRAVTLNDVAVCSVGHAGTGIAGVALDGVDNAVFDFLDDTDMIGLTVLRAGAALVIPIEEDNHARIWFCRTVKPPILSPKPINPSDAA